MLGIHNLLDTNVQLPNIGLQKSCMNTLQLQNPGIFLIIFRWLVWLPVLEQLRLW